MRDEDRASPPDSIARRTAEASTQGVASHSTGEARGDRAGPGSDRLARWGPALAAAAAALAAIPGLWFPFLADDWLMIAAVAEGAPPASALGYLRPVNMATFWVDLRVWGLAPALFHATNLVLIAVAAALVAAAVLRYTADPRLAAGAGLLFALHPYHVENAAWVSGRADPLYSIFFILALLAYDRWRAKPRAVPLLALALFETAMLSKETAVVLPLLVALVGALDARRRPSTAEMARGYAPMIALAGLHLFVLRALLLGDEARTLWQGSWREWLKHIAGYAVGAVIPADVETLASRPAAWTLLWLGMLIGLGLLSVLRSGRLPRLALGGGAAFLVLAAPAVIGFQQWYLFLAVAASSLCLAALIGSLRGRLAVGVGAAIGVGWMGSLAVQWGNWWEAARASQSLIEDLVYASRRPGVEEIVVANMPFRVRGGAVYVYGEFLDALALSGGRPIPVRAASYIALPESRADALDGPPSAAVEVGPDRARVSLKVEEGPFSHYCGPGRLDQAGAFETGSGQVSLDGEGRVTVRIEAKPGGTRSAYAWVDGRLVALF